jgi:SAM-dependent methyltransferase
VIGELYQHAPAGSVRPEIEHADGTRIPLAVDDWFRTGPGDWSLLDRCHGPTLDVGSGPGRLTVALGERGIPALGIDITPYAVHVSRTAGALTLLRDVFDRVPGTGRWVTVLLADGSIGIGGNPSVLLRRVTELLTPAGQALVEVKPPGEPLRQERIRFRHGELTGSWCPWAYVGADQISGIAEDAGLIAVQTWSAEGRWFAVLRNAPAGIVLGTGFLPAGYRIGIGRTRLPGRP